MACGVLSKACSGAFRSAANANKARRAPIKRGAGGAKKHTPGHNTKSGPQKTKRFGAAQAKKAEAEKKAMDKLRETWDTGMSDQARQMHTKTFGGFEGWAADQLKRAK